MEPICGPPLAAGDHRYPGRGCTATLNSKLMDSGRISDEQASGLLSLSLHPLSLSIAAGQTGATRLGREVGGEKAQAVSHSEESIATPRRGDKQRCLMIRMRTVYNARTGSSMQPRRALNGERDRGTKKTARGAGAAPSRQSTPPQEPTFSTSRVDRRWRPRGSYQLNFTPNFAIRGGSTVVAFSNAAPARQLMLIGGVRVHQVVEVEEQPEAGLAPEAKLLLGADVEHRDRVLPPRADAARRG